MSGGIQEELRQFATRVLEHRGALVDWPVGTGAGTAVVPEEVAAAVGIDDDTIRLTDQPGGEGWCVSLGTDFLETAGRLLEAEPRTGSFAASRLYLKRGSLEEAVRRAFAWLNAKVVVRDTRATHVEYHTWWFRASLTSEDRWETRLAVTVNSATGVEIDLPDPLALWELEPRQVTGRKPPSTYPRAVARALPRVKAAAEDFFCRMDGRIERDRRRLREYYGALLREADHKKPRGGATPDPEKTAERKRAVELELRRKLAELDERYAIAGSLQPLVLIRTVLPAMAVDLSVQRKRASKRHTLYWNPLVRAIEPMCCGRCGNGIFSVAFTDDDVDPRCADCRR
ncbi:MAG: hypothetical protein GXX96_13145 [Planctomycetaceae bacterium]|jgi:hypothetical protein|nr:hypothetical protein [Planctomycetaceae bacterium]